MDDISCSISQLGVVLDCFEFVESEKIVAANKLLDCFSSTRTCTLFVSNASNNRFFFGARFETFLFEPEPPVLDWDILMLFFEESEIVFIKKMVQNKVTLEKLYLWMEMRLNLAFDVSFLDDTTKVAARLCLFLFQTCY